VSGLCSYCIAGACSDDHASRNRRDDIQAMREDGFLAGYCKALEDAAALVERASVHDTPGEVAEKIRGLGKGAP
jgi:hypothetical protein